VVVEVWQEVGVAVGDYLSLSEFGPEGRIYLSLSQLGLSGEMYLSLSV
jgi:hypothetical protein